VAEETLKNWISYAWMESGCLTACGASLKMLYLEAGESIGNAIVSTINVGNYDMYVVLCCTEIDHAYKGHYF